MDQLSDKTILSGLKSAVSIEQEKALKQIYAQNFTIVQSYIIKNNGDEKDAADIFQDALIVFYEKVSSGELTLTSSVRTYMYSVCKRLWLNRLRDKKKLTRMDENKMANNIAPESYTAIETNERSELIAQLMEKLDSNCKQVLMYYYFDRLRMKEIALRMGFANDQVAKNKKSKCIKALKSMVSNSSLIKSILKKS